MQKSNNRPYTIFAPHIDDEMIGCWSILYEEKIDKVYYFYDFSPKRIKEAEAAARIYGFDPVFVEDINDWDKTIREDVKGQILLIPSIKDNHPDHKRINRYGRTFDNETYFYSIDMNHKFEVLSEVEQTLKRESLHSLYPSQASLFYSDAKYYLFESIRSSDTRKTIWVSFQKEGIHSYPDAPEEVSFLKHPHRHMFHFRVEIEVFHNDREIEFIMFKRELENLYGNGTLQLNYKSCEMLAEDLEHYILTKYPGRCYNINVSEDNENGAVLYSGDW